MILTKSDRLVSSGKILGWFTACFYALFTLVPDSHSVMVLYPFVSLWQIGLLVSIFWLLILLWQGKVRTLGRGLDWLVAVLIIGLLVSTIGAEFTQQAIWNSWIVICFLAAVYALNSHLKTTQLRHWVLVRQGYLNLAFIVVSLGLWTTQTLLPELRRIAELKQNGIEITFDFSVLELRNWAPIGHQNYVAGYLLLAIPLLIGLSIVERGWRRWLWFGAIALGLLDLYTTSSRGGWLGLIVVGGLGLVLLLFFSSISRLWLVLTGFSGLFFLGVILFANNRFYRLVQALVRGKGGGEFAYRLVNAVLGWRMGASNPLTGAGLGSVPLLYQQYRPFWAGKESELAFQLHSTPFQLWAEMGIWAIACGLGAIAFWLWAVTKLLRRGKTIAKTDRIFCWSICAGFAGYGVMSLTDYQLDNICISGTLVLYIVGLATALDERVTQPKPKQQKYLSLTGWGIAIAFMVWLFPIHRAWQLSSQGFLALAQKDLVTFQQRLAQANKLAPWEPYYPYQLGWNLGDLARENPAPAAKKQLTAASIEWFERAITLSPYLEFGHSNLGWLLINSDPQAASRAFIKSAQLIPAKEGVFWGLAWSLLAQKQTDLAIEALTLEALRHPLLITSPVWRSPVLQPLYPQAIARITARYNQLLQQHPDNSYLRLCRGSLNWWLGNNDAAASDWNADNNSIQQLMLDISSETDLKSQLNQLPSSPITLLVQAWFDPARRKELLQQAWLRKTQTTIPPQILEQLSATMSRSASFERWLKYNSPVFPYRHQRQGFGVVSRHIDGAIPTDYYLIIENIAIATWFEELFPVPIYNPDLEQMLQPFRISLLAKIQQ